MKISVLLPIKLNNQRLPDKSFIELQGQPLYEHTFKRLVAFQKANKDKDVNLYCYCSDETFEENLPPEIDFIQRSPYLDRPETLIQEVIDNFAKLVKSDIYILTHITSPFISVDSMTTALNIMIRDKLDSILSARKISNFCDYDGEPINYDKSKVLPTQQLQSVFEHTNGFFMFNEKTCKEGKRIGNNFKYYVVNDYESVDIDTFADIEFARKFRY